MSTPTNIPETPMGETEQDSFFGSKEKFQQQLQDIFQTILRLTGPDHFDQLCQWMEYKQYYTIDDFYENSYNDLENFDNKGPATEYKWKGKTNHLSPIVAQKLKCFIKWMTHEDRPYELHDDFLATLTRDSYLKFRHMDTQSFSTSSPSHHEPSKLKTSFPGEFKHQTTSESQTALNNFKKGTKRDASVYPIFKNDKYYDTFQRSFLANLKAQGLYDVADPDHDPENGDIYEKELFRGKQSFVYSVLVTSLQTEKGRELVKEFEGDARSIILKLHHFHTKSNVAQHDIITMTTVTEVWILQGIYPLKDEWVFGCSLKTRLAGQTKTQQLKWLWSKDSMNSTINQRLVEQTQETNFKLEGSGGSTLDDTLRKQYLSSSDE